MTQNSVQSIRTHINTLKSWRDEINLEYADDEERTRWCDLTLSIARSELNIAKRKRSPLDTAVERMMITS